MKLTSTRPKTLVLLRGLARETRHWGEFANDLRLLLEPQGFQIVTVDLPGVGVFYKTFPPTSVFANAEFVRSQVLKDFEGPFGLVGVSFGGMIALEWAQNHPEEVQGVIAINTSCRASPSTQRLRWQIWPQFLRLATMSDFKTREKGVTQLVINHPERQKKAWESWVSVARDFKLHPMAFANQIFSASRFQPTEGLEGSERVLIISSDGDRLVDPSCGSLLAERWKWPFKTHPWGGHDLAWDDPQWLIQQIQAFFP